MIINKKWAILALLVGVISIVMGVLFIAQGIDKQNVIKAAMVSENITYGGAGSTIVGIIDTPQEAQQMADILKEHRFALGNYSQLKRDDPNRQTILNAMTMENSLALAQVGNGLIQVVEANGAFMILIGLTLGTGGMVSVLGKRRQNNPVNDPK